MDVLDSLPGFSGSYAVLLSLSAPLRLPVGRLGTFLFPAGDLVYLGSANGPGGLRARLRHHFAPAPRPHWHLDYLRPHCALRAAAYTVKPGEGLKVECGWSQSLAREPGARIPAAGFGASDCRSGCPAHLIAFPGGLSAERLLAALAAGEMDLTIEMLRLWEAGG